MGALLVLREDIPGDDRGVPRAPDIETGRLPPTRTERTNIVLNRLSSNNQLHPASRLRLILPRLLLEWLQLTSRTTSHHTRQVRVILDTQPSTLQSTLHHKSRSFVAVRVGRDRIRARTATLPRRDPLGQEIQGDAMQFLSYRALDFHSRRSRYWVEAAGIIARVPVLVRARGRVVAIAAIARAHARGRGRGHGLVRGDGNEARIATETDELIHGPLVLTAPALVLVLAAHAAPDRARGRADPISHNLYHLDLEACRLELGLYRLLEAMHRHRS